MLVYKRGKVTSNEHNRLSQLRDSDNLHSSCNDAVELGALIKATSTVVDSARGFCLTQLSAFLHMNQTKYVVDVFAP